MSRLENRPYVDKWLKVVVGYARNVVVGDEDVPMDIIDLIRRFFVKIYDFTRNIEIIDDSPKSKLEFAATRVALCQSHDGNCIYILGYDSNRLMDTRTCVSYDLRTNGYSKLFRMPGALRHAQALQAPNGKYVVIYPSERDDIHDLLLVYDPNNKKRKWQRIKQPHNHGFGSRSCFDKNGILHIVGGYEAMSRHSMFDFDRSKKWRSFITPLFARMGGALTLGPDGCLYYFGGFHSLERELFDDMYIFDENNIKWKLGKVSLPVEIRSFAYCNTGMQFIMLGGYDSRGLSSSIYIYNFKSQEWFEQSKQLPMALIDSAACLVDNQIHVFGGSNMNGNHDCHIIVTVND